MNRTPEETARLLAVDAARDWLAVERVKAMSNETHNKPTCILIGYEDWLELCKLLDLHPLMTVVEVLERVASLVSHEKEVARMEWQNDN